MQSESKTAAEVRLHAAVAAWSTKSADWGKLNGLGREGAIAAVIVSQETGFPGVIMQTVNQLPDNDGIRVGFFTTKPAYIDNVKADSESEYGEPYILSKLGSGQVAVFHGFIDDYSVCDMARQRIEAEGGVYTCSPASEAVGGRPWWKLW